MHFTPTQAPRSPLTIEDMYGLMEKEIHRLQVKLDIAYRTLAEYQLGEKPKQTLFEIEADYRKSVEDLEAARREVGQIQQEEKKLAKERKKHPGHGPTEQPNLPIKETKIDLPADAKACPVCKGQLEAMGEQFEESEQIDVEVKAYIRRKTKRQKYRCRCNSCVVTAPAPKRIIPGGRYSDEFILQVVSDKYLYHVPLERQARQMRSLGLDITTQTLYDQAEGFTTFVSPICLEFGELQNLEPLIHADETRWPRLDAKKLANWMVWTRTSPRITHISILESKSAKAAKSLFPGYKGTIVADGYQVYKKLVAEDPNLRLANCWTHVLRKFIEIRDNFPTSCDKVIGLIRKLYEVEREVGGPFPGGNEPQALRLQLRQEKSVHFLKEIKEWAEVEVGLPNSELGKAIRYMLKRWKELTLFLEDPIVPLDNNAAERSIRGAVIGRKVHYGSKSKRGTEVAATFYTIFETAKLNCRDPVAYLREAIRRLHKDGTPLMPWDYQAEIDAAAPPPANS